MAQILPDHYSLIDELDTQQNQLLDALDDLNLQIEAVLASLTVITADQPTHTPRPPELGPKIAQTSQNTLILAHYLAILWNLITIQIYDLMGA